VIKRLDCAPSYPQPAAHSIPEPPNHAEVRSSTTLAYSEYLVSAFQANQRNRIEQRHTRLQPIQSISDLGSQQPANCGEPVQAIGKRRSLPSEKPIESISIRLAPRVPISKRPSKVTPFQGKYRLTKGHSNAIIPGSIPSVSAAARPALFRLSFCLNRSIIGAQLIPYCGSGAPLCVHAH